MSPRRMKFLTCNNQENNDYIEETFFIYISQFSIAKGVQKQLKIFRKI